jgi:hypothetical protein
MDNIKPEGKVGQRWIWEKTYECAIGEIVEPMYKGGITMKVIQIIRGKTLDSYALNTTFQAALYLDPWSYLVGQDKVV